MNTRAIGTKYETIAAQYLIDNGYEMVQRNFRCKIGEIDIIARDKEYLCFIEVKYRGHGALISGLEAVDYKKQKTIYNVARFYLHTNGISENTACRFDVISIDENENITLVKNAFP